MKEYNIPISWESFKRIKVNADDLQSAIDKALRQFLNEPDDLYLDDSFEIDDILEEEYPDEKYNLLEIYENL